jgi:bacterioferritin-associated ferredoxin
MVLKDSVLRLARPMLTRQGSADALQKRHCDPCGAIVVIICSCNNISDADVRRCAASTDCRQTVSEIYAALGHKAECGTCARTIRAILLEVHPSQHEGASCVTCPVRAQIDASRARTHRDTAGACAAPAYDFLLAAE